MKNDKFFHRGGFQNYSCGDHWLTIISNQKACFWNPSEPTILRPLSLMDRQFSNFFKRVSFHSTITTMSHRLIAESSLLTHMTNIFSSKNYFCFRKFSFFEIHFLFKSMNVKITHFSEFEYCKNTAGCNGCTRTHQLHSSIFNSNHIWWN